MSGKRPDGEGTVRKRSDGRWEGRVVIGHREDGAPIYKSVFAKTQKELLPKLHAVIDEYRGVDLSESSSMTLSEWTERWLREYAEPTLRPNTFRSYRQLIDCYIAPALGQKQLRSVTQKDVQRLYNSMKKQPVSRTESDRTLSDATVRRTHMVLHEIMEAAVRAKLISRNPTQGTKVPKNNYKPKTILNEEQLESFMEAIQSEPVWRDFFYTELTTGLRLGEICGLKWSDLDEEAGRLTVRRSVKKGPGGALEIGETKTEKGTRSILLPASTLRLLRERRAAAVTEWIFPSPLHPEEPVSPSSAYNRLKKILRDAKLPDLRFHDLRHTFATHALTSGVDPKTLSGILGHTNASFTLDTYTHVTTGMQKNAAGIVGGFIDELFGEELTQWQGNEKQAKAPSA